MSILVIDHPGERKAAIEHALMRAGLLLTERGYLAPMTMLEKLEKSTMLIIVADDPAIEWSNPLWQPVLKALIVIGSKVTIENKPAKESVIYQPHTELSDDLFIAGLLRKVLNTFYQYYFPVTVDEQMKAMLAVAKKAARSSASILIEGETGTGKEVIAQYIHHHSTFAKGPFVAINCAAIPESMIEASLFGYEKGAFTNAINSYVGKFEQANHGTLFLDEIAEMSTDLQAKLLRVLQENEFERIGGKATYKVDLRVIAATNQNLTAQIQSGRFRPDLYYRLNVINLKCLPLRERVNDIELLAAYFAKLYAQQLGIGNCTFDDEALASLKGYAWPGNVRQLQNVIHRAVIMQEGNLIKSHDLGLTLLINTLGAADQDYSLRAIEAETIVNVLKETNGCRRDAAKRLMISPRTLRHKILKLKEIGMDVP